MAASLSTSRSDGRFRSQILEEKPRHEELGGEVVRFGFVAAGAVPIVEVRVSAMLQLVELRMSNKVPDP
jgi:hypothetical protein